MIERIRTWLETFLGVSFAQMGVLAVLLFLVLLGAALLYWLNRPQPITVREASEGLPEAVSTTENKLMYVHVVGAVRQPGVYSLDEGKRVTDVLELAGGLLPEADVDALNLAARLRDGQRIYVPKPGEMPPGGAATQTGPADANGLATTADSGPLDLNIATGEQIERLPGIGPILAKRIVEYRDSQGGFKSVEDLNKVDGIGPKKYQELKDKVIVN